jgi:ribose 5-phosphate isomerase A
MALDIEECKRAAAQLAVKENFPSDPRFVGIGSGSTIVYVVEAIMALGQDVTKVCFVPTGYQSRELIMNVGLVPVHFGSLPDQVVLDICFDGADEVDEDLNCIKGGGACLFQEKLVAMRSKKFICVAGQTPTSIPHALHLLSPLSPLPSPFFPPFSQPPTPSPS